MSSCEKGHQWQQALQLFDEMPMVQISPDVISYTSIIACCERGARWQVAVNLFASLPNVGISPNAITYSAAISCCEKAARWQQASQLFDVMLSNKMVPDTVGYNATLTSCERGGQFRQDWKNSELQASLLSMMQNYNATARDGKSQLELELSRQDRLGLRGQKRDI